MSNKEDYQPHGIEDVEAEDELFGEVIEQSDAHIDSVNVMSRSDLSEASSPARGSAIQLPQRRSNHAGVEDQDRPVVRETSFSSANSGVLLAVGVVVVVVAGLFLFTMGSDEEPTTPGVTSGAVTAPSPDPTPRVADEVPAEDDEGRGDGTPTLDVATITKGMVAAGWRVGPASVDRLDEVTQTNVLAQKDSIAATVTIYESKTWDWAQQLLLETEPPARALSFGRTVVRVSLGPPAQQNGVLELTQALTDLKTAARAKATGEVGEEAPAE